MHIHTIGVPAGWTVDEVESWLDQGLALPDDEPESWVNYMCEGVVADCRWHLDAVARGESFEYMDYRDHTLDPPGVIDL
jgi:hypothetical protein